MVFKGAATLIVRLSRTLIARPIKPILITRTYQISQSTRYYLFPSLYRSFFNQSNGQLPFRMALNEIKRRLFFAGL
jgi:hypothetical protein